MKRRLVAVSSILALTLVPVPTSSGALGEQELTLSRSRRVVTYGEGVLLSGRLSSGETPGCVAGVEVSIQDDGWDDSPYNWFEIATVTTDRDGRYWLPFMPYNSANYRAEVQDPPAGCTPVRSNRVTVRVKLQVKLKPATATVRRGDVVKLVVKVRPLCEKVVLAKLVDGRFKRVASKTANQWCTAVFKRRLRKDNVFRAWHPHVAAPGGYYLGNRSSLSAISVRR